MRYMLAAPATLVPSVADELLGSSPGAVVRCLFRLSGETMDSECHPGVGMATNWFVILWFGGVDRLYCFDSHGAYGLVLAAIHSCIHF
ncbi:uncharacterized protein GGS22DRAFT_122074 [Annulohypoxylon maeteangense]|uniref:uncharacterized protein n=1 Tax=Annulohypoxylon maeteangense TaxID=1927788 RepID=UPI0020082AFD|nr:uncharacterized protein GGS22DRAFT_122074 [Annulohypoxylon maeteangense]KAI0885967.1 hypothetical protein GGS22DRAFT_122074 [Annulohypoxylon maeteangense]